VGLFATSPPAAEAPDAVRERIHTLSRRYRTEAADGFAAEFHLAIDGLPFRVSIGEGRCSVAEERPAFPTAAITMDAATWLALDDGTLSSFDAFLEGRIRVRGNIDQAVRMQSLFRPSGRQRSPLDLEHVEVRAGAHVLSCFSVGEGPPVVLLHGLGATRLSWMPLLQPLADRYRVLAPDLPGHGESSKPRVTYTPRFYAGVIGRLLAELELDRAVLVGNSMGGRIALEVAARAPARVAGLVLVGPAVAGLPFPYYARLLRLLPAELGAFPVPMRRRLVLLGIKQLFAHPERLPRNAYTAGADEFIRVYRSGRARVALLGAMRGLMRDRPDLFWDAVRQVGAPALVIHGEQDRLVPVRLGEILASALPRAELVVLPGVGHVPQFEVPETTVELVRGFLDGIYPAESVTAKRAPRGALGS
jgi:pimeloyl-ACP methyl ester carboxylesterase/putative sterol carrier protein